MVCRLNVEKSRAQHNPQRKYDMASDTTATAGSGTTCSTMLAGVTITSYGHTHGPPTSATILINARHFPNPPRRMRATHNGTHRTLQDEFFKTMDCEEQYQRLKTSLLTSVTASGVPSHELIVGIGCEEGRHRSVAIVERLGRELPEVILAHRDLQRADKQKHTRRAERKGRSGCGDSVDDSA